MKNTPHIPACEECARHSGTIFRMLKSDELDEINYEKRCSVYKKGSIVFQEGNRTNGFFCVNSGVLKMYKTGIDGKEQIIRFAKKGDIMGYRSILSGEAACTTAKVLEDAVLCFIPSKTLFNLVKTNPEFSMELIQRTAHELGDANKYIMNIAQKTVRERLAEILLLLKDTFETDSNGVLQINLTREELANIVGTATESVIRLLSEFKQDKLITLNGRKIALLDVKGLEHISSMYL